MRPLGRRFYLEMPVFKRPQNFSWIVDNVLAGSAFPMKAGNFRYFRHVGIRHVVNLTPYLSPDDIIPPDITTVSIPIEEFEAPSLQQIQQFVSVVEGARKLNQGVVVHCYWGRGRTGTMLAAYLVKQGHMTAEEAITEVRQKRPYSVETYQQEDAVFEYADSLKSDLAAAEGQKVNGSASENGESPSTSVN